MLSDQPVQMVSATLRNASSELELKVLIWPAVAAGLAWVAAILTLLLVIYGPKLRT